MRLAILVLLFSLLAPTRAAELEPGQQAPDIFGRSLAEDRKYHLTDFRGKVVILDFWASWCGPCIVSMPELETLRKRLIAAGLGDRFEILGVNLDQSADDAKTFLKVHPVSYPVISDLFGLGSRAYEPRKLPSTYVISPSGQVNFIYYGYGKGYGDELESRVREQLNIAAEKTGDHRVLPVNN